jgi:hypothetical protein
MRPTYPCPPTIFEASIFLNVQSTYPSTFTHLQRLSHLHPPTIFKDSYPEYATYTHPYPPTILQRLSPYTQLQTVPYWSRSDERTSTTSLYCEIFTSLISRSGNTHWSLPPGGMSIP